MAVKRACDTPQWKKRYMMDFNRGLRRTTGPKRAEKHVKELIERYGASIRAIADAAGTASLVISELAAGTCTGMMVSTEEAILKVRFQHIMDRSNPDAKVPSTGLRRRLQALLTMGWRHQDLEPLLGFDSGVVLYQQGDVTFRKHEATKRVYDQLWNKRGPADLRTQRAVAKAGYAPPLAWDDDSIDDPTAAPDLGARIYAQGRAPEGALHQADATVEDMEFLIREGLSWETLAERLGRTPGSLERALHRKGRSDLIAKAKTIYATAS
ncbi:helix-turn-helix DNA-binding domain protein [Arthrobacter phage Popper]|uniref:Helix-turn-helix DNA binding domain protein n=1 Tax=Arthrobacter phage Popper TaxID=2859633 RepID=A0AAE8BFC0_9CAUD|nr:helix-turn-helix DNA-binding domain protein [Arthrobacter phage Popper]QYC54969.1 helix-turn-helix DNA-binding domain protein [Arthrobacter phage Popper]